MITDEGYVDGSWELSISVDDLGIERILRVHGDWHIGGVMFKLVDGLELKMNWSDYALWWPQENSWLLHTRSTLDQYGIQANAKLRFLRMHSAVRVQLPDLQIKEISVNFAKSVFSVVSQICKSIGTRHPEELSLMRPIRNEDLTKPRIKNIKRPEFVAHKKDSSHKNGDIYRETPKSQRPPSINDNLYNYETIGYDSQSLAHNSNWVSTLKSNSTGPDSSDHVNQRRYSTPLSPYYDKKYLTLPSTLGTPKTSPKLSHRQTPYPSSLNTLDFNGVDNVLSESISAHDAFKYRGVVCPKNLLQRARINGAWLESSKSLMEQCIEPGTDFTIQLRFKYFNFYDLNPKYDAIRIHLLYQQAHWAILSEAIECPEEEMMFFGGLQLQIEQYCSEYADLDYNIGNTNILNDHNDDFPMLSLDTPQTDEIDALLDEIQLNLEGQLPNENCVSNEIRYIPTLSGYVKLLKPQRFSLKGFKERWLLLKDTTLFIYKSHEESLLPDSHCEKLNLRGCEFQPNISIATEKYGVRAFIVKEKSMQELWFAFADQRSYSEWTSAIRLASRGKTLASKTLYEKEKESILNFLQLKSTTIQQEMVDNTNDIPHFEPENYVQKRYLRKTKERVVVQQIREAQRKVIRMGNMEAKMHYIKAWQQLPQFGITYFVVRFNNCKTNDLLGVAYNRIMKVHPKSGDINQTWRFSEMRSWRVNWEIKKVFIDFATEKLFFQPISASCQILHEMIGACVFLSMRSADKNQNLDEETFHKLTSSSL